MEVERDISLDETLRRLWVVGRRGEGVLIGELDSVLR